jgi:hypothetical protein
MTLSFITKAPYVIPPKRPGAISPKKAFGQVVVATPTGVSLRRRRISKSFLPSVKA